MHVVVRVDATPALGWGHLKRCLALADVLHRRGALVQFIGRSDGAAVPAAVAAAGCRWSSLALSEPAGPPDPRRDAAGTLAAIGPQRPDVVVVDHYQLDARWHEAMRQATGARLLVIDDLADRPLAPDLLVDHNLAPDHAAKYAAVLPPGVPICAGPRHALLDAAYVRHPRPAFRPQVRKIGLFLGGSDPANHSAWALQVLRQRAGWQGAVEIATTASNPHRDALQALARRLGASLQCDLPNLAAFHASCDLQIGAGGGALWERCSLGVPTVALICADNQRQSVPALAATGAVIGLDARGQSAAQADALEAELRRLLASPERRAALRDRSLGLVDGRGAMRVADRLAALCAVETPPAACA